MLPIANCLLRALTFPCLPLLRMLFPGHTKHEGVGAVQQPASTRGAAGA